MNSGKIIIGIVGLRFGEDIIKHLMPPHPAHEYFEIGGIFDLNGTRSRSVATRWGLREYASMEEMLADPRIEAVGLFTPPTGRAGLLLSIIEAGKHVMTTKPIEFNPERLEEVLREARKTNRIIHANSPGPRPTVDMRQMDQWREQYDLGRVISVRGEVWASYAEKADNGWYDDFQACPAAPILRLGVYLINDFIHVAGEPVHMQVMTSRIRTGRPTPDNAVLQLRSAEGCLGTIFASFCIDDGDSYRNTLTINFERGTIYRNCGPNKSTTHMRESEVTLIRGTGCRRTELVHLYVDDISGNYLWQDFYKEVRSGACLSKGYEARMIASARAISRLAEAQQIVISEGE